MVIGKSLFVTRYQFAPKAQLVTCHASLVTAPKALPPPTQRELAELVYGYLKIHFTFFKPPEHDKTALFS